MTFAVKVRALWFQPEVGMHGYYGAVLVDGTPVALCSKERWDMGPRDSLRKGWRGNLRVWPKPKVVHVPYTEAELRKGGLWKLTCPAEFR